MHLGVIDTPTLGCHADALASRRPSPQELFQRWDTQQWKIADIELEKDIPGENNPNKQYRQTQATGRQDRASRPSIACTPHKRDPDAAGSHALPGKGTLKIVWLGSSACAGFGLDSTAPDALAADSIPAVVPSSRTGSKES